MFQWSVYTRFNDLCLHVLMVCEYTRFNGVWVCFDCMNVMVCLCTGVLMVRFTCVFLLRVCVSGLVALSEERKVCTGSEKFFKMCESNEVRGGEREGRG